MISLEKVPKTEARAEGLSRLDLQPWIGFGLIVIAFAPWWLAQAKLSWLRPHYQFFPLVIFGGIFLLWDRLRRCDHREPGSVRMATISLVGCWLGLLLTMWWGSPWLGTAMSLFVLAAAIHALGGWPLCRWLLPSWCFFWLLLPLPVGLDQQLVQALQRWTAAGSSMVLDHLGVFHVMAGNVIEVPGKRLLVEEACSGVNSFFAVLAGSAFLMIWRNRTWPAALVVIASAGSWVLVASVARVVAVAFLSSQWGWPVVEGWAHDAFGWLVYVVALGLILSTDRLACFFLGSSNPRQSSPRRESPRAAETKNEMLLSQLGQAGWFARPMLLGWIVLIGVQWAFGSAPVSELKVHAEIVPESTFDSSLLPGNWEAWERVDFVPHRRHRPDQVGEVSWVWRYKKESKTAALSLDFPFRGWHELSECYVAQGWKILGHQEAPGSHGGAAWVEVRFERSLERFGYLLFTLVDEQGRPLRTNNPGDKVASKATAYQIQLFVETYRPLVAGEQKVLQDFFHHGVRSVAQRLDSIKEESR